MKRVLRLLAVVCLIWLGMANAMAQAIATTLTIASIKQALEEVLQSFNSVINTAGNEIRSSGASLAGNAQNVISDLNTQLGGRLNQTIGQLQGAQRQLAEDAVLLTRQMRDATNAIASNAGAEARRTVWEADITAYNASYSSPCRTLTPRVLYVTPDSLRRGSGPMEVRVRGNFLDIGSVPRVTVADKEAKLIARARSELVVALPPEVVASITDARSVQVAFPLQELRRTNYWVYCHERNADLAAPASVAVLVRPELSYHITGVIRGTYDTYESWSQGFKYSKSDGDCGANFDDNKQWCAPDGYELVPGGISLQRHSANCNSSIGDPQISGARCVVVPAHLGGCGYDNLIVGRNCRGRGWFDYTLTLTARRATPANAPAHAFKFVSADGTQRNFQESHPQATGNLPNARWQYQVTVEVKEGSKILRTIAAGDGNPNPEGVSTKSSGGVVYVNVGL
jgi:hypothetical protein